MQDIRTKIGEVGRVIIPAIIRQQLHLTPGDEIILHIQDDALHISTPQHSLKKLQNKVKRFMETSDQPFSLVDELIAQRHIEAERE